MPVSQNPKECGWFYHAPARKEPGKPRVDYPAPSNIPGIGYDDPSLLQKDTVREMLFKETDSEYIRLAKMGGRKDLLTFNPDRYRKNAKEPVGYPRNNWFYLEDNKKEDEEKKETGNKQWNFLVPDYMVHHGYQPSFENSDVAPVRSAAPYYTEATSVMQEEGRLASDKTVKIAESRRPGYGVRHEKNLTTTQKILPREKLGKDHDLDTVDVDKKRNRSHLILPTEKEEPTNMSKLLAGEYERQWYTKLAELQQRTGMAHGQPETLSATEANIATYGHQKNETVGAVPTSHHHKNIEDEEEKDLFKLNRFKNIPSKLDSQQRAEILATLK